MSHSDTIAEEHSTPNHNSKGRKSNCIKYSEETREAAKTKDAHKCATKNSLKGHR